VAPSKRRLLPGPPQHHLLDRLTPAIGCRDAGDPRPYMGLRLNENVAPYAGSRHVLFRRGQYPGGPSGIGPPGPQGRRVGPQAGASRSPPLRKQKRIPPHSAAGVDMEMNILCSPTVRPRGGAPGNLRFAQACRNGIWPIELVVAKDRPNPAGKRSGCPPGVESAPRGASGNFCFSLGKNENAIQI